MADPITPNTPDVNGRPMVMFVASTKGAGAQTVDLPTYAPLIDLRVGHPILSLAAIQYETDVTGSELFDAAHEMARGTAPDSAGEWNIVDSNTVTVYRAADKNFALFISYIPFGSQQA